MLKRITKFTFVFAIAALAMTLSQDAKAQGVALQPSSIENLSTELSSPEKIVQFIFRHFYVESDQRQFGKEEFWQSPAELLKNGKGDCEDFALFAAEMLKANGVSSFLINLYGAKTAHTICVFKENGKYHVIDGDEVKRIDAGELNEVFSNIAPDWETAQMVGYSASGNNGRVLKTFKNNC